ncbi:venom allergen 5 [Rhodnius prolixus]|uniref:Putative defense-related protein n=1 Tax=Rhodnius prolixus TaxID=13249 RepID=R4G7V0_RHOPR
MHPFIQILLIALAIKCALSCQGGQVLSREVSPEEQQLILDVHNRYRQAIALGKIRGQPTGSNMIEMSWDDELANMAQQWADNCVFRHDTNIRRTSRRFPVGQNLAISWSSPTPNKYGEAAEWAAQIRNWFNEVYTSGNDIKKSGHYTQVVWGDSYLVGCGYTYYKDPRKNGYVKLYVCNYGPAGNVIGEPPYIEGTPGCDRSDLKPSSSYLGLCDFVDY